jgi:hypothetical protein
MRQKKQPAEACHRPAGVEYIADGNAAVAFIPRQQGKGHDAIELRKNPAPKSKRGWVVQLNGYHSFSIKEQQLRSPRRFRNVATHQLRRRVRDHRNLQRDLSGLPQVGWRPMVERLIAALERGGE